MDQTVNFHPADRRNQRFSFKAFKFLGNATQIFIHCFVFLCHKQSTDQRCLAGCHGNTIHRAKRDLDGISAAKMGSKTHSDNYLIEVGPIVFNKDKEGKDDAVKSKNISSIVLFVFFFKFFFFL